MNYNKIYKLASIYKTAIYNEFWKSKTHLINNNTENTALELYNAFKTLKQKTNSDVLPILVPYVIDLFDKIVYRPSYGRSVNLHNEEDYTYGAQFNFNKKAEQFLHDLIHEALDPGISSAFYDAEYSDEMPQYELHNYISEHAAQFVGNEGDTTFFETFGITKYISEELSTYMKEDIFTNGNVEEELLETLQSTSDPEKINEIFYQILIDKIKDDSSYLKVQYKNFADILINNVKKIYRQKDINVSSYDAFCRIFIEKLNKETKKSLSNLKSKSTSKNILDDKDIAIGNRCLMFLAILKNKLSDPSVLDKLVNEIEQLEQ